MGIAPSALDVTAAERRTVLALLKRHLPNTTVWAYGSRVKWTSRPASDLDLVAFARPEQGARVAELREAFEESDLPFSVDLFVWDEISEGFRKRIETEHTVLAEEAPCAIEDWPAATLGDCIEINSSTYAPKDSWPFINYLDTGSVTENRIAEIQHLVVGKDEIPSRARRKVLPGDIVYSTVRPNQKHFGLLKSVPDNFLASTGFSVIRGKRGLACTDFIYWFLAQDRVVEQLQTIAEHSTSAYPSIKSTDIERLTLNLPPLPEQRAIAHVLGALDDKIELNRRMNATLEATARALFQSWFVDFDPVRAKMAGRDTGLPKEIADLFPDRLMDSESGPIPKGWTLKPLGAIAHFQNGLALQKHRPRENEARLPVIKIAQLRRGKPDGMEWASAAIRSECILDDGDVVFSWSGSLMVTIWCGGRAALNQHLFKVTSRNYPKWFVLGWIQHHLPEFQRIAATKATTMGHIRRHHLDDVLCTVPNRAVFEAINETCSAITQRVAATRIDSRNLIALQNALLPQLLSGRMSANQLTVDDTPLTSSCL